MVTGVHAILECMEVLLQHASRQINAHHTMGSTDTCRYGGILYYTHCGTRRSTMTLCTIMLLVHVHDNNGMVLVVHVHDNNGMVLV